MVINSTQMRELKRIYRKFLFSFHPDKNKGETDYFFYHRYGQKNLFEDALEDNNVTESSSFQ